MLKKYSSRFISFLGGDGLDRDFMSTTAVHVLFCLGTGLSSVFISVFLFKMNNSDYVLTAKYNAYSFFFEIITFTICLLFYKVTSIVKTLRLGLAFYALSYIFLLIFRNQLIDYYILVAFLSAFGAGLYWSGHFILLKQHTSDRIRQRAMGFLGLSCCIVSIIASPLSGILTNYLPEMTGYLTIFSITIVLFGVCIYISKDIKCASTEGYKINLINSFKYVITSKGTFYVFLSELVRGIRDGMGIYFITILLYSVTSNELIVGLSLTLKNFSAIITHYYVKSIKNPKQRIKSSILSIALELILLIIIVINVDSILGGFTIFLFSFLHMFASILSNNSSQIPLFESMNLLVKYCKTDTEFVAIKQLFLNSGRLLGIMMLLIDPTNTEFCIYMLMVASVLCLIATFLAGRGSKLMSKEVDND